MSFSEASFEEYHTLSERIDKMILDIDHFQSPFESSSYKWKCNMIVFSVIHYDPEMHVIAANGPHKAGEGDSGIPKAISTIGYDCESQFVCCAILYSLACGANISFSLLLPCLFFSVDWIDVRYHWWGFGWWWGWGRDRRVDKSGDFMFLIEDFIGTTEITTF